MTQGSGGLSSGTLTLADLENVEKLFPKLYPGPFDLGDEVELCYRDENLPILLELIQLMTSSKAVRFSSRKVTYLPSGMAILRNVTRFERLDWPRSPASATLIAIIQTREKESTI